MLLKHSTLVPSQLIKACSFCSMAVSPPNYTASGQHASGLEKRSFVAESAGSELVFFTLSGDGARLLDRARLPCFLPPPGRCYSFCVPSSARDRVRAARLHRHLQRRLSQSSLGARSKVLPLLSYSPQEAALEKGFLVQDELRSPETERFLEQLVRHHLPAPAHFAVYEVEAQDGELWCALWRVGAADGRKALVCRRRVVALEEAKVHPAIADLHDAAVFSSRNAARRVLEECIPIIPESKAVLDLVDKCPEDPKKGDFPVIVIEGLDATGKTTVTHALKDSLNAVLLRSPPSCVSRWRKIFDDEPTLIRRAFYALTNYIVASEIAKASTTSPVIVDRYWHSTAAYAIATEVNGKVLHLPPLHHPVYHWPEDLLRPDLVLLLTVNPEERIQRLQGRGIEKTKEESDLETNCFFRQKVEESYRRMENPVCQPVDASSSKEDVLKAALQVIKKQFHKL
uniref:UMP-CMP kinase 2, mitochondrial n=1 Tax=Salvator merianae TaxID=96440 RepID=A0A8D0DM75_SALMN